MVGLDNGKIVNICIHSSLKGSVTGALGNRQIKTIGLRIETHELGNLIIR